MIGQMRVVERDDQAASAGPFGEHARRGGHRVAERGRAGRDLGGKVGAQGGEGLVARRLDPEHRVALAVGVFERSRKNRRAAHPGFTGDHDRPGLPVQQRGTNAIYLLSSPYESPRHRSFSPSEPRW